MSKRLSEANIGHNFPDINLSPIRKSPNADPVVFEDLDESSFIEELLSQKKERDRHRVDETTYSRSRVSRSLFGRSSYSNSTNVVPESDYEDGNASGIYDSNGQMMTNIFDNSSEMDLHMPTTPREDSLNDVNPTIESEMVQLEESIVEPESNTRCGLMMQTSHREYGKPVDLGDTIPILRPFAPSPIPKYIPRAPVVDGFDSSSDEDSRRIEELQTISKDEDSARSRNVIVDSSDKDYRFLANQVDSYFERSSGRSVDILDISSGNARSLVLRGSRVMVEVNCCKEMASRLRNQLREMGAMVAYRLSSAVTHIVFTSGAEKDLVHNALNMENRPHMVATQWIEDCYKERCHKSEEPYSLFQCRFLVEKLRRRSTLSNGAGSTRTSHVNGNEAVHMVELSPEDDLIPGNTHNQVRRSSVESELQGSHMNESEELTFDHPLSASELLEKIDILTRKLERVERCDSAGHGVRCESRIRVESVTRRRTETHEHSLSEQSGYVAGHESDYPSDDEGENVTPPPTSTTDIRQRTSPREFVKSKDVGIAASLSLVNRQVLRRRTHDGFSLEHRLPFSVAVDVRRQNRDVCETIPEQPLIESESDEEEPEGSLDRSASPLSAMAQSMATLDIRNHHSPANNTSDDSPQEYRFLKKIKSRGDSRKERPHVNIDVFDDSLSPPRQNVTVKTPLIVTNSSVLNNLQCLPSSDEFVSTGRAVPLRMTKTSVVLTGVNKNQEAVLTQKILNLGLTKERAVDSKTRCVVSGNDCRTLSVLKAIVYEVPIVTIDWVLESTRDGKVLSMKRFESDEWSHIVKLRAESIRSSTGCRLLRPLGRILIVQGCNPSTDQMRILVRKSGGLRISDADMIVCPSDITPPTPPAHTQPLVSIVSEKYILDCITSNEVLLLNGYLREDMDYMSSEEELVE